MKDGQTWFYEISEFFSRFLSVEQISYMGFERVNTRGRACTSGVFEFPISFRFTEEFKKEIGSYTSDRIQFLVSYENINRYRHCVIVVLS